MQRAPGLDAFLAKPTGRFLAGRAWVYFCAHPEVFGIVFFGRLDHADVEALTRALVVELGDGVVPHRSLIDARRLQGVDPGAFEGLNEYVRCHRARLAERVTRLALVRPTGMAGALVAGFYDVVGPPYPVEVFEDGNAALAWLGEPASTLFRELASAVDQVTGLDATVSALRALLVGHRELGPTEACRSLAMSERTLQRRLHAAGTSFRKEVLLARIDEAQRRLLDSDDPLTQIALEIGFSSPQHFSNLFRTATGEAPSAWRARHRRAK